MEGKKFQGHDEGTSAPPSAPTGYESPAAHAPLNSTPQPPAKGGEKKG